MPVNAALGAVGAVSSLAAGSAQRRAAKRAERTQKAAKAEALQYLDGTEDAYRPYAETGQDALRTLAGLYGVGGGEPYSESALEAFRRSPDYRFAYDEGLRAVEQSQAAKGSLFSGGTLKRLTEFGQGMAGQNFGAYAGRLGELARLGLSGVSGMANAATNRANVVTGQAGRVADAQIGQGEATASGFMGASNALTSALGQGAENSVLQKFLRNNSSYANSTANSGNYADAWSMN